MRNNTSPLLQGIRVLDLTHVVSGPYATRYLALLGAEVIKIENPKTGGDMSRYTGQVKTAGSAANSKRSVRFCSLNHNKRSIRLDLSRPEGREVFLELVKKADVVMDNFKPGTTKKLGISFEELRQVNPKIVCGSISGFGMNGPYRDLPSYDIIAQAMSGVMLLNGEEGMPPVKIGTSMADVIAGLNLAIGVLAGVHKATVTGCGCQVETDLVDGLVSALMMEYIACLNTGVAPNRLGNHYREWCPFGAYAAKDGYYALAVGRDADFQRLATEVLQRPDMAEDPRFTTHSARIQNRELVNGAVDAWAADKTVAEVVEILRAAGVPCGPVMSVPDVIADPHIHDHRNMFPSYTQPEGGELTVTNIPLRTPDTQAVPLTPAPEMGADTCAVLQEILGMDEKKLQQLQKDGII